MDKPTEPVATDNPTLRRTEPDFRLAGRSLAEALMGPPFVVVLNELAHHVREAAPTKDQQVVEGLLGVQYRPIARQTSWPQGT